MAMLTQIDRCTVAANSTRIFGTPSALNNIGAQTHIAYVKPTAVGGGNFSYLYGKTPSGSINGPRFFIDHNGGSPRLTFGVHSSAVGAPQRSSENNFVGYSSGWQYLSATWDGSLNATGIAVYKRLDAEASSSEPASYATNVNGTGSVTSDSANNAVIGNRYGGGRAFAGDRAWHAILAGHKTQAQIDEAIDNGILSHPDLIALFVNGDEIANDTISQTSTSGVTTITDSAQFPEDTDLGEKGGATFDAYLERAVLAASATSSISALLSSTLTATQLSASSGSTIFSDLNATLDSVFFSSDVSGESIVYASTDVTLNDVGFASEVSVSNFASFSSLCENVQVISEADVAIEANFDKELAKMNLVAQINSNITLHADHDRASVNLSGSSVSGTGDSAVISIKPKVQESEVVSSTTRWLKPHVRVSGVNGIKPKFRFLDYKSGTGGFVAYPWPATRRPMYSYTAAEDDWFYFDNCALTDGVHAEFWNNTNFSADEIYVCWNRAVRPKRFAQWLDGWQTAHPTRVFPTQPAIDHTPTANVSTWPAQMFIADEFSTQTDSLGATVPVTPLYSFAIRDDSVSSPLGQKAAIHFQMMTHAGEDMGLYIVKAMIEHLLAGAGDAPALLQYFDFTFSFNNVPGWVSGGWRGSWTQGTAGADDSNRHSHETTSGLEIVDKPKAVMQSILSGKTVAMFIDMHGDHTQKLWIFNTTTTDDTDFVDAINSFGLPTISLGGSTEGTGFWSTWANTYTGDSFTYEVGDPEPVPDADLTAAGVNLARAINKLRVDGNLNMPTTVGVSFNKLLADVVFESSAVVSNSATFDTFLSEVTFSGQAVSSNFAAVDSYLESVEFVSFVGQHAIYANMSVDLFEIRSECSAGVRTFGSLNVALQNAILSGNATSTNSANFDVLTSSVQMVGSSSVRTLAQSDVYLQNTSLYARIGDVIVSVPSHRTIAAGKKNRTIYV